MKTPWVVGIVVMAHVVALGTIVLMQGCGTTRVPMSETEAPLPPTWEEVREETRAVVPPPPQERIRIRPDLPAETTTYVVGKGDTLSGIAHRFGLNVKEVMAINGIDNPNRIRSGQKLILPGKVDVSRAPSPAPARSEAKPVAAPAGSSVYTVKAGDSLSVIASRHGTTVAAIRKANGMTGDKIIVGQKLVVPGAAAPSGTSRPAVPAPDAGAPAAPVAPALPDVNLDVEPVKSNVSAGGAVAPVEGATTSAGQSAPPLTERVHVVEAGEDLYSVAMLWAVSVAELKELNKLQDTELKPGQRLRIPMSE